MPSTENVANDDAISGGISDARNSAIFNMFPLIEVGERSGMGLCDIYSHWKEYGYEKPVIKETINPDRTTLTLNIEYEGNRDGNEGNRGGNEGNRDGNVDGNLSEMERRIFSVIKGNNTLSAKKIAEKLEISASTVERATKKLKAMKYIERNGKTRGAWINEAHQSKRHRGRDL